MGKLARRSKRRIRRFSGASDVRGFNGTPSVPLFPIAIGLGVLALLSVSSSAQSAAQNVITLGSNLVNLATDWIKAQQWVPLDPPLRGTPGNRSPATYYAVAQQFNVEHSPRYAPPGDGRTWCNIYVWDVTRAMGVEIPHWYDPATGASRPMGLGSEMRANDMVAWLKAGHGWTAVDAATARARAAAGIPTTVVWPNPGGIGHVAMLMPDGTIAQAGASNLWRKPISHGFGNRAVLYFTAPS